MAFERPTFSDQWHRVAELRPRLRSLVQSSRQQYRGHTWYIFRDPSNNKFSRVDDAGHRFIGMLDGRRTVDEVWKACCEQLGDRAPTQGEAVQLLGQLYASNLLEADLPADAAGMFRRRTKRIRREVGGYIMGLLFARIPLWDPDRFLNRWVKLVGWCFGPIGIALWSVLLFCGLMSLAGKGGQLVNQTEGVLSPGNLPWLYVSMVVLKLVHELGHGFCCKHFGRRRHAGGEVHTLGIMFMVLMPVPYVDASSAWSLPSKWQRAFIGAAGMYAELAVASIAAIIWANSASGTLVHALAYNAIFIAGVSTLLFNLNPLIKFDGYYILSDLIESPNLMQRSKDMLYYVVKKYAFGVKRPRKPTDGRREQAWLITYAILSSIYRVFLSVTIFFFIADKLFFVGMMMAALAIVGWVVVPLGKFTHYLTVGPELVRVRSRALGVTLGTVAALVVILGFIPVAERDRAEGVVEPREIVAVHAGADGFIRRMLPSNSAVLAGEDALFVSEDRELESRRDQLIARLQEMQARRRSAIVEETAEAQAMLEQVRALHEQLARVESDLEKLTRRAPFDGVWVCGSSDTSTGMYLRRGEAMGYVATLDDLRIRVAADQFLGPRLPREAGTVVELRARNRPDQEMVGRVTRVVRGGRRQLPSPALGLMGGGELAVSSDQQQGDMAASPFFEVEIEVEPGEDGSPPALYAGQRVVARFELGRAPLLVQGWRALRQVLQERFRI